MKSETEKRSAKMQKGTLHASQIDTLLTVKDVAEILSIGIRTTWRMASAGKIPKPIRIGTKLTRWKASQLQAYLDALPG